MVGNVLFWAQVERLTYIVHFDNPGPLWSWTWQPKQGLTFYGNDDPYPKVVYVANSTLSWLGEHSRIFRLFVKGKFDAYVLWPLAKRNQNWIVDRSTACDFTVYVIMDHYENRVTEGGASDSWLYPLKAYPLRSMYVVSIFPSCCTQWSNQAMPTAIWSCY